MKSREVRIEHRVGVLVVAQRFEATTQTWGHLLHIILSKIHLL